MYSVLIGETISQGRVLLVEDNPDNFDLVRFLPERAGYEVLEVHDGLTGVNLARLELPDLVVMDLSLILLGSGVV